MKKPNAHLLLLAGVLLGGRVRATDTRHEDPLSLATRYLKAREATMQATAGPADVDKALSYCLPSLIYEHPRVGVRLTALDSIREGMLSFLGSSRSASIKVVASLPGVEMVAVQTDVAFEAQDGTKWQAVRRQQVWVFEFEGSKIKRIIEYW